MEELDDVLFWSQPIPFLSWDFLELFINMFRDFSFVFEWDKNFQL